MKNILLLLAITAPATVLAQGLQQYIPTLVTFISNTVIPFIIGIAFLIVVINTVRFFVFQSAEQEGREKAKGFLLYSVLAFVLIIAFWGIINLLVSATGLSGANAPTSDFPGFQTPTGDGS